MLPLLLELHKTKGIETRLCVTAQHRELLDSCLTPFGIVPDYDLNLMMPGQSLGELTARALGGLEAVIKEAKPDWVLVHGDTSTTFVASLAAFYNGVKVGHVEAGLRTYDKTQPFPEEMNRKLTTALADVHFAPTELAREQLLKENVPADSVFVTGNTAVDFIRCVTEATKEGYVFQNQELRKAFELLEPDLPEPKNRRIILLTAHRRENWGQPIADICHAVAKLADDFPALYFIYPMHPNPARDAAKDILGGHERILLTEPLGSFDLISLMARCWLVLTDSGGLQEEAPALNKPVVVLREVTERPEGAAAGTLVLAGTNRERVYQTVADLYADESRYAKMAEAENPFGDGYAAKRIVEALLGAGK